MISESARLDGLLAAGANGRSHSAAAVLNLNLDFDTILHILSGDAFYEQNKRDVAKLEKEAGRPVTELWDTDPIFSKYPNLRMLGRNAEFEKMWAKLKSAKKEKQK